MNQTLLQFLIAKTPDLIDKIFQQIYLAGLGVVVAILIGIPLGICAVRNFRLRGMILGTSNILQTIPSLALLAFLIPFFGIGVKPAIIALSLYALLPIVRNTVTGLLGVAPEIKEAADGLGFTRQQKLWMVELPLAIPTIIAGIRTATAMSIGIATLAAFIGAGGLGDFIYQGIALNDNRLVLLGAIPAALLALILDFLIGQFELALIKRKFKTTSYRKAALAIFVIIIALFLGLFFKFFIFHQSNSSQNTVRIATKNFSEQFILGYLMADMIEAKTQLHVDQKFNLGPTAICQSAMEKGEIDIYPEYTGTAYMTVLDLQNPGSAEQVYQQVKEGYSQRYHIIWLDPFGFNNTQAIAVRQDFATQHHLNNISDLTPLAKQLTIGVPAEFIQRPDGFIGLKNTYGLNFGSIRQMDPGLMYDAIKNKQVNVIMAFSTDGRIPAYHLAVLNDDKHLFPPYYAAPLIREEVLKKHPEIQTALQPLLGLLDDKTMQQLNYEVDVNKRSPDEVARTFLLQKGLIKN